MAHVPSTDLRAPFRTLDELPSPRGRRILVRTSLNVPLRAGAVGDDFRIVAACETLRYLKERGGRVVVIAHIGRNPHDTLAPVAAVLAERVGARWAGGLLGEEARAQAERLGDGEILVVENVRSDAREVANDAGFARTLAAFGDYFVNDAFAASHRAHASIVGIPEQLPSYAGLRFAREYAELSRARSPETPALFLLGGAKAETKLPLIADALTRYEHVFVGGALANDFLRARGYEVGTSKVSAETPGLSAIADDPRVLLPVDVVVEGPNGRRVTTVDSVAPEEAMLDVGPETVAQLAQLIASAKTVVWNGPLGYYEGGYTEATDQVAAHIADSTAYSVVGGGDTVAALEQLGRSRDFSFLSTAGGAMLEFLEKGTLPGIEALG